MFLNDWAESGLAGMLGDFGITEQEAGLVGATILLATYTYEDYSGSAYVLFQRDGKLYEVHGSHCSCFGLSETDYYGNSTSQWDPEETTVKAVLRRIDSYVFDGAREELRQLLERLA